MPYEGWLKSIDMTSCTMIKRHLGTRVAFVAKPSLSDGGGFQSPIPKIASRWPCGWEKGWLCYAFFEPGARGSSQESENERERWSGCRWWFVELASGARNEEVACELLLGWIVERCGWTVWSKGRRSVHAVCPLISLPAVMVAWMHDLFPPLSGQWKSNAFFICITFFIYLSITLPPPPATAHTHTHTHTHTYTHTNTHTCGIIACKNGIVSIVTTVTRVLGLRSLNELLWPASTDTKTKGSLCYV